MDNFRLAGGRFENPTLSGMVGRFSSVVPEF